MCASSSPVLVPECTGPDRIDRVLRPSDAAEYLNLKIGWIYDHADSGMLPCSRVNRMIRFTQTGLDKWLESRCSGFCDGVTHDGSQLLSVKDLQEYLHVSRSWIYEARRSKRLPHYKLGALCRFSRPMVDAWLVSSFGATANGNVGGPNG